MDFDKAIEERHSVRLYTEQKIEGEVLESLQNEISRINEESGMSIRLILDEPKAFSGILMKTVVKFKNAVNYLAISGPESDNLNIDVGYYGEHLVLFAQTLGLGTCWAMMAGKKASDKDVPAGHKTVILISIGYPADPGTPHKNKPVSEVADLTDAPEWFVKGVKYAMLAPTGMNKQGFRFERTDDRVRMIHGSSTLSEIDAGIVKYHFEYGAGKENFTWSE
jgi:nitroreductase